MGAPEGGDENLAEFMTRRIVARATLRKISSLVTSWEEEEKQKKAILRTIPIILLWIVIIVLFTVLTHTKIYYVVGSLLIGVFLSEYISQRLIARIARRKISNHPTNDKEEETEEKAVRKSVRRTILWIVALLLLVVPIFWSAFHSHPKVQSFAGSLLIGFCGAIVLIFWSKHSGKK